MKDNKEEVKVEVITNNFSKKEIEDGKLMGILSYVGVLSLIPYLTEKNNRFVMYHAKQGVNLFLLEIICSVVLSVVGPLMWLLLGVVALVSALVSLASLALSVIGIVNVCNGVTKELPYVNKYYFIK